jgi:uncharacterized Ntn-hydrolase superfamily protein
VVLAHQAQSNPMYGALAVQLVQAGLSPQEALDQIVRGDEGRERRQVAILDIQGRGAAWTGSGASDWKGHRCGKNYCAQGNILMGPEVVDGMAKSFEASTGSLAERLIAALDAAQAAGGDARGKQSAAMHIVKKGCGVWLNNDVVLRLQVDDNPEPIAELRRLVELTGRQRRGRPECFGGL